MSRILPASVTFTGVDEETDLDRVRELSQRYPIEWAVLASPDRQGEPRYPDLAILPRLWDQRVDTAIHLCGRWARAAAEGLNPGVGKYLDHHTGRIQVNVARPVSLARMSQFLDRGNTVILQSRDQDHFPIENRVQWLFDRSGGRGVVQNIYPQVGEGCRLPVGYAGGIGPDNVLAVIDAAVDPADRDDLSYWIDMETKVRTDDWLDLDKCEAVCRQIWGSRASY